MPPLGRYTQLKQPEQNGKGSSVLPSSKFRRRWFGRIRKTDPKVTNQQSVSSSAQNKPNRRDLVNQLEATPQPSPNALEAMDHWDVVDNEVVRYGACVRVPDSYPASVRMECATAFGPNQPPPLCLPCSENERHCVLCRSCFQRLLNDAQSPTVTCPYCRKAFDRDALRKAFVENCLTYPETTRPPRNMLTEADVTEESEQKRRCLTDLRLHPVPPPDPARILTAAELRYQRGAHSVWLQTLRYERLDDFLVCWIPNQGAVNPGTDDADALRPRLDATYDERTGRAYPVNLKQILSGIEEWFVLWCRRRPRVSRRKRPYTKHWNTARASRSSRWRAPWT